MKKKLLLILLFLIVLIGCTDIKISYYIDNELIKEDIINDNYEIYYPLEIEGYTFDGWYLDNNYSEKYESNEINKSLTLYGRYKEKVIYPNINDLEILYINDTHGSIFYNEQTTEIGLSKIGSYIEERRKINPNIIVLAGGDMFQGGALSNYYDGKPILEIMNYLKFDAMVVGNHEFDWKLTTITDYCKEDGLANFPLLGANIINKTTNKIPDNIDPYVILNKGDKKIGIIGIIGDYIETSIAQRMVENYNFDESINYVKKYTKELREEENCDYVIVMHHGDVDYLTNEISNLNNEYKVDVLLNAHTHIAYEEEKNDTIVLQSGSNSKYLGQIIIDGNDKSYNNYGISSNIFYNINNNSNIDSIINKYYDPIKEEFEETILIAGNSYSSYELTKWIAKLMRVVTNSDVAIQNYGGTRTNMQEGQIININYLYKLLPFDNKIKYTYMEGSVLKNYLENNSSYIGYSGLSISEINDNEIYKVASNDYVTDADASYNPFRGYELVDDNIFLRDLIINEMNLQKENGYETFYTNNTIYTKSLMEQSKRLFFFIINSFGNINQL